MTIAIRSPALAASQSAALRWLGTFVSGVRWGVEMQRRYDSQRAAGQRPDSEALRRMADEVDGWLGRRS